MQQPNLRDLRESLWGSDGQMLLQLPVKPHAFRQLV